MSLKSCEITYLYHHHQSVLPKGRSSLQSQEPRLQFWRRQVFHCKLRNQGCSFTMNWIGVAASRCFPHPTLSLAPEQTLKDLKDPRGTNVEVRRVDLVNWPSGLHRNLPQRLNISSIRVFDQIRDLEIPITFRTESKFKFIYPRNLLAAHLNLFASLCINSNCFWGDLIVFCL